MGDRLVGCSSVVKHPYSAMSLTLEIMSHDVSIHIVLLAAKTLSFWDFSSTKQQQISAINDLNLDQVLKLDFCDQQ